jgi:hypothetical protein
MPRPLAPIILSAAWLVGMACLGVAWGSEPSPDTLMTMPGPAGSVALNLGDLTFPGAVLVGFWMLARALPAALRAWTPTLRVELVHVGDDSDNH